MDRYTKLQLFLEEKRNEPFGWAHNNCCFFACDWLAMLTGNDPAVDYRERITSPLTAARVLESDGGVDGIASTICAQRGWQEVDVRLAQRGDAVLIDIGAGDTLGVCAGKDSWFAGESGVARVATLRCRKAWRIS